MAQGVTQYYLPEDQVPLPPADAKVSTTACDYCIVACGYKVYTWPMGKAGGPKASQNALKVDFPVKTNRGKWGTPTMHNARLGDGPRPAEAGGERIAPPRRSSERPPRPAAPAWAAPRTPAYAPHDKPGPGPDTP